MRSTISAVDACCHQRVGAGQRGQSIIELAITLPMLVLILLGAWTVGRAAYDATIVGEAVVEGGKIAAIDRMEPGAGGDKSSGLGAKQLQDREIIQWINEAAHMADNRIARGSIVCNPNFGFKGGDRGTLADGQDSNAIFKALNDVFSSKIGSFASQGVLNPSLETVNVKYNFDTGLSTDWTLSIPYRFTFTKYQMVFFPSLTHGQEAPAC